MIGQKRLPGGGKRKVCGIAGSYLEANLGYDDTAPYGFDTVALGFSDSLGGPTAKSQVVSAFATDDYYLGVFGLSHQATNISNFTDPQPTFLGVMKNENLIPSLSWAYTAGAPYRLKGVFGSLTLGGYDRSRFTPNNLSLSLASDVTRDLVVGLHSVTSTSSNDSITQQTSLLPTPILAFIDSTLPYIYLPLEACKKFERTLGLSWSETDAMYWVSDTLHKRLVASNINFTFTIGDSTTGGSTVQIVLPYASFDLEVKSPFEPQTMRYFPLQQAYNESEYTLGRAFLQEAYIITDYERSNFSVSQARFETNTPMDLVSIQSLDETHESVPSASASVVSRPDHRHRDIIIGATIGAAAFLFLFVIVTMLAMRMRRRKKSREGSQSQNVTTQHEDSVVPPAPIPMQEIGNNSLIWPFREVADNGVVELPEKNTPSEDHSQSSRASHLSRPDAHALQSRRSSQLNTLSEHGDPRRIHLSTTLSRSCRANTAPSTGTSGIETVIFASPMSTDFDLDVTSIAASNTKAAIFSSYLRKPLDLNRSLPPTPISESPQWSPAVANFNRGFSFREQPLKTPTNSPTIISAFASPNYPISSFFPRGRLPVGLLLDNAKFVDSTLTRGERRTERSTNFREGWE
ncbi:MAG: hypothetical protein Q9195_005650 [Heterodermia aff. obscurata]